MTDILHYRLLITTPISLKLQNTMPLRQFIESERVIADAHADSSLFVCRCYMVLFFVSPQDLELSTHNH